MKNKQNRVSVVNTMIRAGTLLLVTMLFASPIYSQGGTARYVYDDNGRLLAVISPTGEANVYDYDAAGNFVAIRRLTSSDLAVFAFNPRSGLPGDLVTFVGVGFGAGVSNVSFNGAGASIISVNPSTVIAQVPQAATTGPVSITTPQGTVTTSTPFVIKGVRLSPTTIKILPGDKIQFIANVSVGNADPSLVWSVNGVIGGNATVGTVTTSGLYTAPGQPSSVVIRATSAAVPSLFGEANVTIQNPDDLRYVTSVSITVQRPTASAGTFAQTGAFSPGVSVQRPTATAGTFVETGAFSPGIAVQRPTATAGTFAQTGAFSPGVTVQRPTATAGTFAQTGAFSPGMTVQRPTATAGTFAQTGAFSGHLTLQICYRPHLNHCRRRHRHSSPFNRASSRPQAACP